MTYCTLWSGVERSCAGKAVVDPVLTDIAFLTIGTAWETPAKYDVSYLRGAHSRLEARNEI